jgi:hypothetical protein
MTTLFEIKNEWLKSFRNHYDDSYMLLFRDREDGVWHFLNGKRKISNVVVSLNLAHNAGLGLVPQYMYDIENPDVDGLAMAMIINRKEGKIIIEDENEQYGFGFSEYDAPAEELFCYIRTETEHTYIFFSQNGCVVQTMAALPLEYVDETECYLPDVFTATHVETTTKA